MSNCWFMGEKQPTITSFLFGDSWRGQSGNFVSPRTAWETFRQLGIWVTAIEVVLTEITLKVWNTLEAHNAACCWLLERKFSCIFLYKQKPSKSVMFDFITSSSSLALISPLFRPLRICVTQPGIGLHIYFPFVAGGLRKWHSTWPGIIYMFLQVIISHLGYL